MKNAHLRRCPHPSSTTYLSGTPFSEGLRGALHLDIFDQPWGKSKYSGKLMAIVLSRIDNRLIHGQVIEAWVPSVKADCIIVANDQVAQHSFQKVLMEAAVPRGIRVEVSDLETVASVLGSDDCKARRVLLLFASSGDALKAHRSGVPFSELNLGNMHGGEGKMRYSCTIALDPEDIDNLASLEEEGVRIVSQCIPSDRQQEWRKLIRSVGN